MKGQIMVSRIVVDIIHVAILKYVFFAANLVTSRFRVEKWEYSRSQLARVHGRAYRSWIILHLEYMVPVVYWFKWRVKKFQIEANQMWSEKRWPEFSMWFGG